MRAIPISPSPPAAATTPGEPPGADHRRGSPCSAWRRDAAIGDRQARRSHRRARTQNRTRWWATGLGLRWRLAGLPLLCGTLMAAAAPALAEPPSPYSLPADPVLSRLISESLAARPEIAEGEATVQALVARVPQAGALPDPMLQLGLQNDGFTSIEVGEMETSFVSIMASQTLPWPGKLGLRAAIAELDAERGRQSVERLRLSTEAEVRRAHLALLLARDRLALLDRLAGLWEKSAAVARAVYQAGGGSQADLLRSDLELSRLEQRRLALLAEERTLVQRLNRLRGHPLDEPITTATRLAELTMPGLITEQAALDDAAARSPELAASRLALTADERSVELASKGYYPDPVLSAGVMPRGGRFPPMWLLSIGGTIPVFAGSRQSRAVEEAEARAAAGRAGVEAVEQLLRLRALERLTVLAALTDTIRLFRDRLLVQSQTTATSTLAQYQVGKVSFASVLDANAGYLADEDAYLQTIAEAQRIVITALELSLEPVAVSAGAGMGSAAMPGRGVTGSTTSAGASGAADSSAIAAAERSMSGM